MGNKLTNGLLLLCIVGLLIIYFFTVNDLPGRIYTSAQQEYLDYNDRLNIAQGAPFVNLLAFGDTGGTPEMVTLMPSGESRVQAALNAHYEEQQGVSVTIYDLEFQGQYLLTGTTSPTATVELYFPFPGSLETLHDVRFLVDDVEPSDANYTTRGISWRTTLQSGETRRINISYKARGANSFAYGLPRDQRSQIDVVVTVTGLSGSNVPRTSLPTTGNTSADERETFTWNYTGLIAYRDIQLSLPTRLSFVQRIAQLQDEFRALAGLAPFLVGLFVACLAGLFSLNGLRFRLEGYLLAGLGLALFYPFLTFTSGVIGILPAAIVTLVVVSGLLFVFLGLAVGWAKTWRPLGLLLLVFVGFFSLGMLTPWRGLLLTSGSLLLLGTFMWVYARRPLGLSPISVSKSETLTATPAGAAGSQPVMAQSPVETLKTPVHAYCFHCGRVLEDTYRFCPGCGHDAQAIRRCSHCDHLQYVPPDTEPVYCVQCGHVLA